MIFEIWHCASPHRAVSSDDVNATRWRTASREQYGKVAEIVATTVEDAYALTQNDADPAHPWLSHVCVLLRAPHAERERDTGVGDVLVAETGATFLVTHAGFQVLFPASRLDQEEVTYLLALIALDDEAAVEARLAHPLSAMRRTVAAKLELQRADSRERSRLFQALERLLQGHHQMIEQMEQERLLLLM